jgi:S1-C subfamily serine protease
MKQGDIILELDQDPVKNLEQFNKKLLGYKDGDTILFLVKRRGATIYLTLKILE